MSVTRRGWEIATAAPRKPFCCGEYSIRSRSAVVRAMESVGMTGRGDVTRLNPPADSAEGSNLLTGSRSRLDDLSRAAEYPALTSPPCPRA